MKRHRLSAMIGLAAFLLAGLRCGAAQGCESAFAEGGRPRIAPQVKPSLPHLHLQPTSATLAPDDFGVQFLAEVRPPNEESGRDVTTETAWSVEPAGIVAIDAGYVHALRPGKATVRAVRGGVTAEAEVDVWDRNQ